MGHEVNADEVIVIKDSRYLSQATDMLARAFFEDPCIRWIFPNPHKRLRKFVRLGMGLLRFGASVGEIHATSPKIEGVAMWLPPQSIVPTTWQILRFAATLPLAVGMESFRRMLTFVDHTDGARERRLSGPHWYLQMLGVDPSHRGEGHAGALLRFMLAKLDAMGARCCLDTTKEANVALYEHFGFRVRESRRVPGSDCTCWLMARERSGLHLTL